MEKKLIYGNRASLKSWPDQAEILIDTEGVNKVQLMKKQKKQKHEGGIPGFIWSSKAYYAKINNLEHNLMIGVYFEEGGTSGEFSIAWEKIGSELTACINMFEDSFSLLTEFDIFFKRLADLDGKNPTEQQVIDILQELGFKDFTMYSAPQGYEQTCFAVSIETAGVPIPEHLFPPLNPTDERIKKGIFLLDAGSEVELYSNAKLGEFRKFLVLGPVKDIDAYLKNAKDRR
jgi:hypothetical protein